MSKKSGFGDRANFKPSKISDIPPDTPFVQLSLPFIESNALRSLSSRWSFLALFRLIAEHLNHAGKENGYLAVRYSDFVKWGVLRKHIPTVIKELVSAKLLVIEHKGRGIKGDGDPSLYRLTFLKSKHVPAAGSPKYFEPTNDWQKLERGDMASIRSARTSLGSHVGNPAKTGFRVPTGGTQPVTTGGTQRSPQKPVSAIPLGSHVGNRSYTLRCTVGSAPKPPAPNGHDR